MINPQIDKETFLTQQTLSFNKNQTIINNGFCEECDIPIEADDPFYLIDLRRLCLICKDKRNKLMGVIELK